VGGLSAWQQAGYPVDSESAVAPVLTPGALASATPVPGTIASATPVAGTIISSVDMPRITVPELKAKLDAGQAVVFDVRQQSDYAQKHIAGAISMPQSEVADRLAELPADKMTVFYCT